MSDQPTMKRGWVKNAAIVFLSVMLVLTFFSNTFLNYSLPEVAVQYTESGTITAKIRGTGTVTANETYELSIKQSREVASVLVKTGDLVTAGDTLFVLSDSESQELEAAKDALEDLNLQYQKALINASSADYAQERRAIDLAQQELTEALAERSGNQVSQAEVDAARAELDEWTDKVNEINRELKNMGAGSVTDEQITKAERGIRDKKAEISAAEDELTAAETRYANEWEEIRAAADSQYPYLSPQWRGFVAKWTDEQDGLPIGEDDKGNPIYADTNYATAYGVIIKLIDSIDDLEQELGDMKDDLEDLEDEYNESDDYRRLSDKLAKAEDNKAEAQDEYDDLRTAREEWTAANAKVTAAQKNLDDLVFALEEQQKNDGKAQALEGLDLQAMKADIADAQKEVAKLTEEATEATVVANVSGVVKAVNITAGNTTTPDSPLVVIEVPDRGYSLEFAVTAEQAKKVKLGDTAEISNYYWGNSIQAVLTAIKPDPQNPGQGKLLHFSLNGEVDSGSQLSLAIGQRSANYDVIVPNSALRSDSNGDFVLIVTAKNTPLGNRFTATRVPVNVLASDDTNTAVAGGLSSWEYVITTATKPVEAGMQVRLVEN